MSRVTPSIAVAFDRPTQRDAAEALAERLSLPVAKKFRDPHDLHLTLAEPSDIDPVGRLELRVVQPGHPLAKGKPVAVDLTKLDTDSPAGRKLNQPLYKAVGIKKGDPYRPAVLDATAGLGEDAWLFAAAGCTVLALERHPVVHALLEDGLRRAAILQPEIAARITLLHRSANEHLSSPSPETRHLTPDVVYLDPMFPPGRKTVEKKPMRVLRLLAGDDTDAESLLPLAKAHAGRRVVVKRPRLAPPLADEPPTLSHAGKALRFDLYVTV